MTNDKRTKAELLDAVDAAHELRRQADDAKHKMEIDLGKAIAGKVTAKAAADTRGQALDQIRHTITTAVALKHPRTVAFGTVEQVWYRGELMNPGYDGDSEEVRLLKLIYDQCQEALA